MFWLVFLCCLFSDISSVAPCKCLHSRRQDSLEGKEIQEGADVFAPIASLPFIFSDTTISASGYQPVFGAVRCSRSFVKERCISHQSACNFQRPFFNGLRGNEGDVLLPNYNLLQSAGLQTKYFLASYLLSCCQSQGKASSQGIKCTSFCFTCLQAPESDFFLQLLQESGALCHLLVPSANLLSPARISACSSEPLRHAELLSAQQGLMLQATCAAVWHCTLAGVCDTELLNGSSCPCT